MYHLKKKKCLNAWRSDEFLANTYILNIDHGILLDSVILFIKDSQGVFMEYDRNSYDICFKNNYLVFNPNKTLYDKLLMSDCDIKLFFKRRLLKNYIVCDSIVFKSLGSFLRDKDGIEYVL